MLFSQIVKSVRSELSLSQEQLARQLNVSFSTINRWENGKSKPSQMANEIFFTFCKNKNIDINKYQQGGITND